MFAVIIGIVELIWFLPLFLRQGKTNAVGKKYTVFAILIGMTIGLILATLLGVGGKIKSLLNLEDNSIAAIVITSFFTAAFPEEISKFFCGWLMLKCAKPVRKLDYIFIIGGAGLGFGITESFLYGSAGLMAIVRVLEPLHLMWQFYMGEHFYEFVQAKRSGDKPCASKHILLAFLVPILMHGIHDCFSLGISAIPVPTSTEEVPIMTAVYLVAVLLWNIGMIVYSIRTEKRVSRFVRESRVIDSAANA